MKLSSLMWVVGGLLLICLFAPVVSATEGIEWQKVLGGSGPDYSYSVQQTSDGGYILIGDTAPSADGDPARDVLVVKLTSTGSMVWQKVLGGTGDEIGYSIQQTSDGGYILTGVTSSSASGDVTGTNHGGSDVWVVKLDSAGIIQWQKLLGGTGHEDGASIQQTSDGGYILTGSTLSSRTGDVGANHGSIDVWVVKLTSTGTITWQKVLGGWGAESGHSIQQTSDGGYILVGETTTSANEDVAGVNHGGTDVWVVKLTSTGTIAWQKVLGGSGEDIGYRVQQTTDGGYILTGDTTSSDSGDVGVNHGFHDVWVVKLDSAGAIQWQNLLGGTGDEIGSSIQQTNDGGYILTGYTDSSSSGDVASGNHGGGDVWVVKLTSTGTIVWQKLLGGSNYDAGWSIRQTSDGGYILTGDTDSSNSGDVGPNHGHPDVWVVKLYGPTVKMTSPNGGENWGAGTIHTVTWNQTGLEGTPVKIELYKGEIFSHPERTIISSIPAVTGSFDWTIPADLAPGTDYWVLITSISYPSIGDSTDEYLSITPLPTMIVRSPNGGEKWDAGTTHTVTWTQTGLTGTNVKIDLYSAVGELLQFKRPITPSVLAQTGAYDWTIPSDIIPGTNYRVKITSLNAPSVKDFSDAGFEITAPGIVSASFSPYVIPLGKTVRIYGVNTDNSTTYLYLKDLSGLTCDPNGCPLTDLTKKSSDGYFTAVVTAPDGSFEYIWDTSTVTGNLVPGMYGIVVESDPVDYAHRDGHPYAKGQILIEKKLALIPGYTNPSTDPDNDGIYEDLNGNGRLDFADVVLYFNQMEWIAANEPVSAFDLNGNGRIDFADIVKLFGEI